MTIDTKALCQRTAAQHRGFVFHTNKRSAQLVTGHKDLLVFLRATKTVGVGANVWHYYAWQILLDLV